MSQRIKWSRPVFDVIAYEQGKPAGSKPCEVCGELTTVEYCEINQAHPSLLTIWAPLCRKHAQTSLQTWQEATEKFLQPLLSA